MPEFINLESDIKEAEKLLEGMDYKKKTFQRRILGGLATSAKGKVKKNYSSLLNKQSGTLYKSIKRSVNKRGDVATVHANAKAENKTRYGYVLVNGADITPKNGDYLTFRINENWVKVKSVHIAPRDFMESPVKQYLNSSEAQLRVNQITEKYIQDLEKKAQEKANKK